MEPEDLPESDIAIIGMAGHFPGAPDVDALWARVRNGEDCLVDLDPAELIAAGLPASVVQEPAYVRRAGVLEGVDQFDPAFFGIGKRDAAIMDPQHRHLLEVVWESIESSGYVPERFDGAIGVFVGCGVNTYLINNLLSNPQMVDQIGWFLLRHTANDKDFLSTGISYRLDLRGPSVNVQTACSTSLVAIHLAAQSLLSFECDMAIAGGSTIDVPTGRGYRYQEGEVLSPDGYCRAFDAQSGGTVLTPGSGAVALRRLQDAYRDGDPILAVIKASAVNNDGARKVGFFAPSVDGHADVVKEALAVAGLSGRDIQLLEAHGTGTAVGDPIEVAALTEAFRSTTDESGFCRITSTKPNIGHLDTAAGVASVMKVVQALRHQLLPPMANHTAPSPLIDFESTPFFVSAEPAPWPGDAPRRAGVSSLGVGGTNAHVILEEAPAYDPTPPAAPEQVLPLSGLSTKAADELAERIADHLEAAPDTNLADVAHTLAVGRRAMTHRRVVVATDVADAITQLRTPDRRRSAKGKAGEAAPDVVFMFPGGGAQYVGMGAGLDERFSVFHETMREGVERVKALTGIDLAPMMRADGDPEVLKLPRNMLPSVFLTSVALAKQWMAWGVTPRGCIGHSLGEYTAAHLAGVMSLDTALELIDARSRLIERVATVDAAMIAVPLPEAEIASELPPELSLATVNAPDECTVSGRREDVEAFAARLAARDVECQLIPISAAAHSSMLDPILPEFLEVVQRMTLSAPTLPYISNRTGTWVTAEQATSPQYWVDHLRHTVRFADGLATILSEGPTVLVELGPGQALSSAARRQQTKPVAALPALRHPKDDIADTAHTLGAFARLWANGVDVDLDQLTGEGRRRLRLPTYPFQRDRYWIEPGRGRSSTEFFGGSSVELPGGDVSAAPAAPTGPTRIPSLDDWFWEPAWDERSEPAASGSSTSTTDPAGPAGKWLVIGDLDDALLTGVARELERRGALVTTAASFDANDLGDGRSVAVIGGAGRDVTWLESSMQRWMGDAVDAARALGRADEPATLALVTRGATNAGGVASRPVDALAFGPALVAPNEYGELRTVVVDLETEASADAAATVVDELLAGTDPVVARRGARRLVPELRRVAVPALAQGTATFRNGGTYVVTGALGGIGHVLARHLASVHQANLVVVTSGDVPEGEAREQWLAHHGNDDPTSRRIRRVAQLEDLGTKVAVVTADLADPEALRAALDAAERLVGRIDGAIHAAGVVHDRLIEMVTPDDHEAVVGAKARAAVVLAEELERRGADLLVLISSTSTVLAPGGQTSYVGANAVLDALAGARGRLRIATMGYGVWAGTGKAAELAHRLRLGIEDGEPIEHPVLAERTVDRVGAVTLVGSLDARHDWVVDEHRVKGTAVLPGTGHLDLLLSGLRLAGLAEAGLRDVVLLAPLVVPDDRTVTIRVVVTAADERGRRTVQLESDAGYGHAWTVHSEAEVAHDAARATRPRVALDAVATRCGLDGADPLASPRRHALLGSRWDAVDESRLGDGESFGRLTLRNGATVDVDAWTAHPGLVDVATALGVLLGHWDDPNLLYVPTGYEAVTSYAPLPASVAVHARRTAASSEEMLLVDFAVTDVEGNVLLTVDGLGLRPVDHPDSFAIAPPDTVAAAGHGVAPLLALAESLGIKEDEGPELIERLVGSSAPRVVTSSVDLDALLAPPEAPAQAASTGSAGSSTGAATVEDALAAMWRELLGLPEVELDDDFFDMGGHSLIAIRLMARIHRELGVRFQLATLFEAPTIEKLAALVREERPEIDTILASATATETTAGASAEAPTEAAAQAAAADAPAAQTSQPAAASATRADCLIPIRRTGDKEPFFVVHGAGGNVMFLSTLARAMSEDRPVYGFQARGVNVGETIDPSLEAMAERYVAALREFKSGPYLLGGYSGGGIVALEMAHQLKELGEEVAYCVLFDTIPQDHVDPPRGRRRMNLVRNTLRHGIHAVRPFVQTRVRSRLTGEYVETFRDDRLEGMGFGDVSEFGIVDLFDEFTARAERYKMRPYYDVDVLLIKAADVWPMQPDDYLLTKHVRHLDIRTTSFGHRAMFTPECVTKLVELVEPKLDEHEPTSRA